MRYVVGYGGLALCIAACMLIGVRSYRRTAGLTRVVVMSFAVVATVFALWLFVSALANDF